MSVTDTLPLDPDYGLEDSYDDGLLRVSMPGADHLRLVRPPRRQWRLNFNERPASDFTSLHDFYRKVIDDFFIFTFQGRNFATVFAGPPRRVYAGNERHTITCELIEAVNRVLGDGPEDYPQTPLITWAPSRFKSISTGLVISYGGYGFTIAATGVTDMKVDGVSVGAASPVYALPLNLHRLEVQPNTANITEFKFVA